MAGREGEGRGAIAEALPGYDVQGVLGQGAMGVVLGGRHRKLDRAVAIKQLPPAVAEDEEARARFGTEARVLASLTHPHIVPVFDYVEREGLCLLVMEALPGGSVWDRFTSEGLTPATTCAVAVATCAGLQHAHDQQVLHRDIKPENLLFANDQTLKVTDFGIAEVLGGDQTLATAEGGVVGTPAYMAPEQAEGGALGPTADVYATGTLLYELLSGRLPFDADDAVDLLNRRLSEEPRPLPDVAPQVPGPLVEVVMRALSRDPSRRQASARDLGGEVVAAATDAWGADWLEHSAVNVLTPLAPSRPAAPAPADEAAPVVAEPTVDRSRGTRVSGEAPAPTVDDLVRPTLTTGRLRQDGTRIGDLGRDELVAVQDILTPPPVPVRGLAALGACLLALVLVALLGLGAPDRSGAGIPPERVVLGGADLGAEEAAAIDFGEDIGLLVDRQVARGATEAELELSVAGVPVGSTGREELQRAGQGSATTLSAGTLQHLTAGEMTGRLVLYGPRDGVLLEHELEVEPDRGPWATASTVAAVLLLVFVVVYSVSVSGPLRAGRRRRSAFVALPVLGAVGGLVLALLAWSVQLAPELSVLRLLVATALGAAAGAIAAPVLLRLGRRKRLRAARA